MKSVLAILFLSISFLANSQHGQLSGHLSSASMQQSTAYLYIILKKGYMIMNETMTDSSGKFHIDNLSAGLYSLAIKQIGVRKDFIMDSIKIFKDSTLHLEIDYPGPCRFVYEDGKKPQCTNGHTDHLIPIVYGLPARKTIKKAEKGLIYLGGCVVSDCDPHFYCTIHKREL
jgi:hypothetical protein